MIWTHSTQPPLQPTICSNQEGALTGAGHQFKVFLKIYIIKSQMRNSVAFEPSLISGEEQDSPEQEFSCLRPCDASFPPLTTDGAKGNYFPHCSAIELDW